MLVLLLLAGSLLANCGDSSPCANQTVDLQAISHAFAGPGRFSDCPQLTVLPTGDLICDTGGAGILMQRPGYAPTIRIYESYEDIGPTIRYAWTCKDALWLVVRDAIDVLSGRDLRIKATLQRAAEACE